MSRLKDTFLRYRGGNTFILSLCIFVAVWMLVRFIIINFDPDNAWLNLALSFEASITTSLLLDLQFKSTMRDRETLARILSETQEIEQAIEELDEPPTAA